MGTISFKFFTYSLFYMHRDQINQTLHELPNKKSQVLLLLGKLIKRKAYHTAKTEVSSFGFGKRPDCRIISSYDHH